MKTPKGTRVTGALSVLILAGAAFAAVDSTTTASPQHSATQPNIKLVSCNDNSRLAYGPIGGAWGKTAYGTCAMISSGPKPYVYVKWEVDSQSKNRACVKTRGYRWSDGKAYWTSLGCGTSGGAKVHWGKPNVGTAARTAVKAKAVYITSGVPVYFNG
jgi:hypothetical protein